MKRKVALVLAVLLVMCLAGCEKEVIAIEKTADVSAFDAVSEQIPETKAELWSGIEEKTEKIPAAKSADVFIPRSCEVWVANCEEYIAMWNAAGSSSEILRIPKGEAMTLLEWDGRYAKVSYNGEVGYVRSDYIKPQDEEFFAKSLDVVSPGAVYTYEDMMADIEIFKERYPELVETEIIGQSELGRDIPVIRIGREDAEHHVILQGAIHGREYMTAWCLMSMADYWLDNRMERFADICWHIIPMSNPDGVTIAQTEQVTNELLDMYYIDFDLHIYPEEVEEYIKAWKSNGKGTDINRNFPAGWEYINDVTRPSAAFYKGEEPFSSAEAKILRDYTLRYEFDATISYHSSGSIIYWQYGEKQPVNERSYRLGDLVNDVTGYLLIGGEGVNGAGYKDWAIEVLEIPSLTIEIGCGDSPLNEREMYSIFARNYMVLPAIAKWISE